VIVGLKLDVRALALSSCDPQADNNYKLQRNNCQWRDRVVVIHDISSHYKIWLLNNENTQPILWKCFLNPIKYKNAISKNNGIYAISKSSREWEFDITLVKKKNKWLISQNSIPIEMTYIDKEIEKHKKVLKYGSEGQEVCDGRRIPEKEFFTTLH